MNVQLSHSQFVDTPRGRFHVRMRKSGQIPLVLLHGWPESSWCWTPLADTLGERFRLIAPDLRGLGDSERTPGEAHYQKRELALDMLDLLDALDVASCHLAGHDWGGVVAQEMALAAPDRFQRLVLMNIPIINNLRDNLAVRQNARLAGSPMLWYQHFQQQPGLAEQLIPGNESAWLRYFLRTGAGEPLAEETVREYIRCYTIPTTPATAANYYRAMPSDVERWARLGDTVFRQPTLYLHGTGDPVIVPEYLEHADTCFENLELRRIEAGHFLQEECPRQVADLFENFLGD